MTVTTTTAMRRASSAGRPARRRWPWFVLLASLAVNALLVGIFVAQVLDPPPPPHSLEYAVRRFVERAVGILPPGDARLLRSAFDGEREALARMDDNREVVRRRLEELIGSSDFNADELTRTFDAARAANAELKRRIDGTVVEVLSRMSPEGRRRLFDVVE